LQMIQTASVAGTIKILPDDRRRVNIASIFSDWMRQSCLD
jgi:hypothetical protein